MTKSWLPLLGLLPLILLPAIWFAVCLLLSQLSGWSRLHEQYPATTTPNGTVYSGQSGSIGGISYRNSLNIVATREGLFISVLALVAIGHKPLFIPWSAMHDRQERSLAWSRTVRVQVGWPTLTTVELPAGILDAGGARELAR